VSAPDFHPEAFETCWQVREIFWSAFERATRSRSTSSPRYSQGRKPAVAALVRNVARIHQKQLIQCHSPLEMVPGADCGTPKGASLL